jgi:hypothetical protein
MASQIDASKPTSVRAFTADVRANFAAAKSEIEALQTSDGVSFTQSGTGAVSRTVEGRLRDAVHVFDFIPVAEHAAILAGTSTTDVSSYIQAAIDTTKNVVFQAGSYKASGLTQSTDLQSFVCFNGIARLIKNANGVLFTSSGDNVRCINLEFRGDASTPTFTGDNVNATGEHFVLINCGARWAEGRAVKATGGHTQIYGTCDLYQTADATASGYDIEIGVSGTLTAYHELHGIYSSQTTGGILLVDTGSHTIVGGQFGKLKIDAGTSPAGVNGGKTIGARILGNVDVEISGATFSANQFGAVAITFAASTSGCLLDTSNTLASGATVTNNGNANNLIMREVSSGTTNQLKFGGDSALGIMTVAPTTGRFSFPTVDLPNAGRYRIQQASGADGFFIVLDASDNVTVSNAVTGKTFLLNAAGTGTFAFDVNSARRMTINSTGPRVLSDNGASANIKTASALLSAVSGASVTSTGLIPDGAFVLGVTTRITTSLGTSNGTTGYTVGDGTDADRWGAITGTAAGTTSTNADATASFIGAFTAANDVVITATTGNFDGTGAIRVTVLYIDTTAPTS